MDDFDGLCLVIEEPQPFNVEEVRVSLAQLPCYYLHQFLDYRMSLLQEPDEK
jgi:hypothetical protein